MKKLLRPQEYLGLTAPLLLLFFFFITATSAISQNKVIANSVISSSHVDNPLNATSENGLAATLNSYGGIIVGVGGYSGELELQFPNMIPANTTSYVKVDIDGDLLNSLLGGSLGKLLADVLGTVILGNHYFNIEARNGNTTVLSRSSIIPPQDGRFRIVQDKNGDFYIAITPNQPYNRIYIEDNTDALLLGTSNSMEVYHAFYFTDNQCVFDPLFTDYDGNGITLDALNLGGAGVKNPENVLDGDLDSHSEISLGVIGVLASMEQNVYFPSTYSPVDEFSVTLGTDPTLVTLGLLNNINISAYNGPTQVYSENLNSVLSLDLLTLLQNGEKATVVFTPGLSFDRVRVRLSSLLNVNLTQKLDVYDVSVVGPQAPTTNNDSQEFCAIDEPTIADLQVNEPMVIWYNAETGGVPYAPTDPLQNNTIYYASQIVNGCESIERLAVTVTLNDTPTPTTIDDTQEFCVVDEPTVADIQVNEANVIWYNAETGGTPYDPTDVLLDGTIYYAGVTGTSGCESSIRLQVTVTLNDTATPTTINDTQEFCVVDEPTIADLQVNETNVVWYDAQTNGNPYDPTDPLVSGNIYYAAEMGANGCESSVRLEVSVTINDTATPTTIDDTQEFCAVDEPTIANLQVNETNVIWYDAQTNGNPYDPTDPLVSGNIYYAAEMGANGCESSVRLEVTVTINDTATPTTIDDTQEFCAVDEPTVADLQVNETNVVWYDAATNGNPYDPTDLLVSGNIYYAAEMGANGCESSVRLEVTVTINDTATPTTIDDTQEFCAVDEPTVADLQVNETNVVWYDAATNGNPYDPTDLLVSGNIYYAAEMGANGCESSVRLEVTVTINDTATPTTIDDTQEFCAVDEPTVADIQVNETNVVWYNAATGGTPYDPTDLLIDNTIYYAGITGPNGCESAIRLEVTITLNDTPTPTTDDTTQEFCIVDTPTIADLQVNEPNVIWYDAPTGGNPYNPTDPLTNLGIYYAGATGANGCESSVRLAVTVSIIDTATPTTDDDTQEFCAVDEPTIADLQVNEPNVIWYDAPTGGNPYNPTDLLTNETIYYAGATGPNGCESSIRLEVTATLNDTATPTTDDDTQEFCEVDGPTVADLQVNEPNVIWYDAPTGGNAYNPTDLLIDNTTYYAGATGPNGCESSIRLEVLVTLANTATPTTDDDTQEFCEVDEPTVADLQVNEPNIIWYDAPTGGNPYNPTDLLISGNIYYAATTGPNGCESSERLAVSVTINDTVTPTTDDDTQEFCTVDTPTVADLDARGTDIIWYDAPTGGNPYQPTDLLVNNNTYYAASTGANGCESSVRLEVTVTLNDTATPTTDDDTQEFCIVDEPTVGDLQVNEPNITWYDAPTGGNPYLLTDPLVNGNVYYATTTGTNGCESSVRLMVSVTLNDTTTPTTDNETQEFCALDEPTVANLDARGTDIIWYDAETGGNPYATTDLLVDGNTYYAASTGANGCESSVRLAVLVILNSASNPTITSDATGEVCLNTMVTYTTEPGNTNYIWSFTGGELVEGGSPTDNFITLLWISTENTTVSVAYESAANCTSGSVTTFTEEVAICADITIEKTVDIAEPMVGENVKFTITVTNMGPNDFANVQVLEPLPSGYALVNHTTSLGTYVPSTGIWSIDLLPNGETATLVITAEVLGQGEYLNRATIIVSEPNDMDDDNNSAEVGTEPLCLYVFNEFSPNGDGINDNFVITCIENFPNSTIKIYNRYGSLVYEKANYDNSWNGTGNVGNGVKEDKVLPSDTYYYILELGDGTKPKNGWLFLIK